MKLLTQLGAAWSQLPPSALAGLPKPCCKRTAKPLPAATETSDRAARQAALDIGWDLAHALGHSSSVPQAGRTVPEMG
jgi:hypothetical protein